MHQSECVQRGLPVRIIRAGSPCIARSGVLSARRMAAKFQPHSRLVDCHVFKIVARG
jgi:3-keto-L-gulonate-6-phosphate decarboxylase